MAFDEVCRAAAARGVRVTGTEIVGLVPRNSLIEAGKYFLRKQQRSTGVSESELLKIAIHSMGLSDLAPFKPEEKVIEYLLEAENKKNRLIDLTCKDFAEETASESPAPGGGSISAYAGALAPRWAPWSPTSPRTRPGGTPAGRSSPTGPTRGQTLMSELLMLVDEDTEAFNRIMDVFAMPKGTDAEKAARSKALQEATLYATQVPLRTMKASVKVFEIVKAGRPGQSQSVSDCGVGA